MKQFNVRDETHALGRDLSHKTGRSIIIVVQEALEQYERSLRGGNEEDELISRLLDEAAAAITERLCVVIPAALRVVVPTVVEAAVVELRRVQEELREQQAKELEEILRESTPEAPEDDLRVVSYEELYGEEQD